MMIMIIKAIPNNLNFPFPSRAARGREGMAWQGASVLGMLDRLRTNNPK
jgi:hypothetical protein